MYDPKKAHYVLATAIIVKDGKYLIVKRSEKEKMFPNMWTVPGGKLHTDDYSKRPKDTKFYWYNVLEHGLRREVMEEVNLSIKKIKYLTSLASIYPNGIPNIVISMFAEYDSGEIKLSEELTEYAWVTLEEAKNYDLIEGIYEELEMLDRLLKGEEVFEWKKPK